MKTKTILSAAVVTIGLSSAAPAFAQPDPHAHHSMAMSSSSPGSPARVMEVQPTIADLVFTDQSGRRVALRDAVSGPEPVLLNFIFTSCTTICPVMSAGFANLQKRLASEQAPVRLVSISIDPEVDTPARLKEYAASVGAGQNWLFLTGTVADSEAAQRGFGAFRGTKESHSASTFIRRSVSARWERLDGLSSGETLLRTYHGAGDEQSQPGGARQ